MRKFILLLLFLPVTLFARIEPPFWWAGMEEPELQLMVNIPEINKYNVSIIGEGIEFMGAYKTNNPNYYFISLNISGAKPQTFYLNFDFGYEGFSILYELKERAPDSKNRKGFTSSDIMYLITPDRFANGDTTNDNVDGYADKLNRMYDYGRHGGDIKGISDRLDYIQKMGFTAIWLSPLLENNMPNYSYHGYAITDFYKVDPRFGTNEEYILLVEEAKKRGIKVVMDQILNHCGSSHWWITDLPDKEWLNQPGNHQITNHRHSISQDPYASQVDKKRFKEGWFVDDMPDLNLANYYVYKYLTQNSIWWIEYSDISGIRMDTYPYSDVESLDYWSCAIMNEYPNFNIVGEEWSINPIITSYWQQGSKLGNFHSCLPAVMDFPLQSAISNGLANNNLNIVYEMLGNDVVYRNTQNLVIFGDNHDMDRIYRQLNHDFNTYKMAMVMLYTLRGIPQIYYGTELLFTNEKGGDHGQIRQEFSGGWNDHIQDAVSQKGLTKQQKEAQQLLINLAALRKRNKCISTSKLLHYIPKNNVYVYFRFSQEKDEVVMVVINRSGKKQKLDLSNYNEVIKDCKSLKPYTQEEFDKKPSYLHIPENGFMIYELH